MENKYFEIGGCYRCDSFAGAAQSNLVIIVEKTTAKFVVYSVGCYDKGVLTVSYTLKPERRKLVNNLMDGPIDEMVKLDGFFAFTTASRLLPNAYTHRNRIAQEILWARKEGKAKKFNQAVKIQLT
jgi:hypothetical protein